MGQSTKFYVIDNNEGAVTAWSQTASFSGVVTASRTGSANNYEFIMSQLPMLLLLLLKIKFKCTIMIVVTKVYIYGLKRMV